MKSNGVCFAEMGKLSEQKIIDRTLLSIHNYKDFGKRYGDTWKVAEFKTEKAKQKIAENREKFKNCCHIPEGLLLKKNSLSEH